MILSKNKLLMLALLLTSSIYAQPPSWTTEAATTNHHFRANIGQIHDLGGGSVNDVVYHAGDAVHGIFFLNQPKIAYLQRNLATFWACRVDIKFACATEQQQCGNISGFDITDEKANYYDEHLYNGITNIPIYKGIYIDDAFNGIDVIYSSNDAGYVTYYEIDPSANPTDITLEFEGHTSAYSTDDGKIVLTTSLDPVELNQLEAFQYNSASNTLTPLGWKPNWVVNGNQATLQNIGPYNMAEKLYLIDVPNPPTTPSAYIGNNSSEWSVRYGGGEQKTNIQFPTAKLSHEDGGLIRIDKNTEDIYHAMIRPSDNFFKPTPGCEQLNGGGKNDLYITKFKGSNYERVWSTYFGGAGEEFCSKMALSHNSNSDYIYLTGYVLDGNLPLPSSNLGGFVQPTNHGKKDAFVVSFDKIGGFRQWVTHFGGQLDDEGMSITVDDIAHKLYITGYSEASLVSANCTNITTGTFPLCSGTSRYFQNTYGTSTWDEQAFVAEFDIDQNFNTLEWSTLFGGNESDRAFDILKVNNNNEQSLYIVGRTLSEHSGSSAPSVTAPLTSPTIAGDFPFANPGGTGNYFQYTNQTVGDEEAFIAKFDNTFKLAWGSHFGGAGSESFTSLAANQDNDVYAVGVTSTVTQGGSYNLAVNDIWWPTYKPSNFSFYQSNLSGINYSGTPKLDIMITRFSPSGQLKWSTYYGGEDHERAKFGLLEEGNIVTAKVDNVNNLYIYGTSMHKVSSPPTNPSIPIQSVPFGVHGNYYNQSANASTVPGEDVDFGNDAFIAVFNGTYNKLAYSTYFGGRGGNGHPSPSSESDEIANDFDLLGHRGLFITGKQASWGTPYKKPADPKAYDAEFTYVTPGDFNNFITHLKIESWWATTHVKTSNPNEENQDKTAVVSPNPMPEFTKQAIIEVEAENSTPVVVTLYDMLGRSYFNQSYNLIKGVNQLSLDLNKASLSAGTYTIKVIGESYNKSIIVLVK